MHNRLRFISAITLLCGLQRAETMADDRANRNTAKDTAAPASLFGYGASASDVESQPPAAGSSAFVSPQLTRPPGLRDQVLDLYLQSRTESGTASTADAATDVETAPSLPAPLTSDVRHLADSLPLIPPSGGIIDPAQGSLFAEESGLLPGKAFQNVLKTEDTSSGSVTSASATAPPPIPAVPEPSTFALLCVGFGLLAGTQIARRVSE